MTIEPAALTNLRTDQRQLDVDGVEVAVSRQALEETFAYIERLQVPLEPPTRQRIRHTHTYSTTDIVILDGFIYAEDFSHETQLEAPERVGKFIDPKRFRKFGPFDGESAMHLFTMWLQEEGAVVDKCWNVGAELSDAERQA